MTIRKKGIRKKGIDTDNIPSPLPAEVFRPVALRFVARVTDQGHDPEMWRMLRMLFAPGWPAIGDRKVSRCPYCRSQDHTMRPEVHKYARTCNMCKRDFRCGPGGTPFVPDADSRYDQEEADSGVPEL